jgi:hypothetical protein
MEKSEDNVTATLFLLIMETVWIKLEHVRNERLPLELLSF